MNSLSNFKISLKNAVALNRITMGLFFFFSGIANYLNFNVKNGFYHLILAEFDSLSVEGEVRVWDVC